VDFIEASDGRGKPRDEVDAPLSFPNAAEIARRHSLKVGASQIRHCASNLFLNLELLGFHVPKNSSAELFGPYVKGLGELDDGAQARLPASTLKQGNLGAM